MTTLDAFFAELTDCHAAYAWYCTESGAVRGTRDGQSFCPLTAVAYAQTGAYVFPALYRDAAHLLGLMRGVGIVLADAADNEVHHPSRVDPIRQRLLAVLGLQEEGTP